MFVWGINLSAKNKFFYKRSSGYKNNDLMKIFYCLLFISCLMVTCKKPTLGSSTYTFKVVDEYTYGPIPGAKLIASISKKENHYIYTVDTLGTSNANGEVTCPFKKISPEYGSGNIRAIHSNYFDNFWGVNNEDIDFNTEQLIKINLYTTVGVVLHRVTPPSACLSTPGSFELILRVDTTMVCTGANCDAIVYSDTTIFLKVPSKSSINYWWFIYKIPDDCGNGNDNGYYDSPQQSTDVLSGYKDTTYVHINF